MTAASESMTAASEIAAPTLIDRPLVVHRLVQLGLFVALTWKWWFFVQANKIYGSIPVSDPFFPEFFRSLWTLRVAYLGSLAAICCSFFVAHYGIRRLCGLSTLLGMTCMCLHQASYNDATFTTAWWTSLWAMWFVRYVHLEGRESDLRQPAFLSRLIISMILLGGAVGKWTSEYWSGEVLYEIYFVDRNFWVFNLLRDNYDAESLRHIAMWYSRKVIVVETVCGFGLWMLPPRWAAAIGIFVLTSIAVFSNWLLFSVLMSLIAMATVGLFVRD